MSDRPLLLLDVDGVLNACPDDPRKTPPGFKTHRVRVDRVPYRLRLNASHGPKLLAVAEKHGLELTWATTWEERANTHIAPLIGLPTSLPVVKVGYGYNPDADRIWKHVAVDRYAGRRPYAWIDDMFTPGDKLAAMARTQAGIPTLLVQTDKDIGLTDLHLARIDAWAADLADPVGAP